MPEAEVEKHSGRRRFGEGVRRQTPTQSRVSSLDIRGLFVFKPFTQFGLRECLSLVVWEDYVKREERLLTQQLASSPETLFADIFPTLADLHPQPQRAVSSHVYRKKT